VTPTARIIARLVLFGDYTIENDAWVPGWRKV
jgi:hypothetical protein